MLQDEDRAWLKTLHLDLWPEPDRRTKGEKVRDHFFPESRKTPEPKPPKELLTQEELDRILDLVREHKLLTSMFSSNMFGGYGMHVYEHEPYPGTGPSKLIAITEDHLPPPTRLERAVGDGEKRPKKHPGCGRDDAWEMFSPFTHSEQNREWLKSYKMEPPRDRTYYDY